MPNEVLIAILSGIFSIIIGYISYRSAVSTSRREAQVKFLETLMQKRLETYPALVKITQEIGKKRQYQDGTKINLPLTKQVENMRKSVMELKNWQSESAGFLILSANSLKAFYDLKQVLKKNPATKKGFSNEQYKKIFYARNALRGALRDDLGIFQTADLENDLD